MKLVVTGGAGYIGSVVSAMLIEAGHEVIVLDNLSEGHQSSVPKGAVFIKGNISDFGALFTVKDKIDTVLHFASYIAAGESMLSPDKYWQNNTVDSLSMLRGIKEAGINKLIFSSSAAVYGNSGIVPITEQTPKEPNSTYGMTKLAVEMAISSGCFESGLAATSLRYFNVAGAYKNFGERHRNETHIIPVALKAADTDKEFIIYGDDYPTDDGTCIRDYIHIYDLARAHILALDKLEASKHTIYNLGIDKGYSNRQVVRAVEKVTGNNLKVKIGLRREGDPSVLIASSKLANVMLGWRPEMPELERMVNDAWEFYKSTQQ